jgi:hypothetical protein
MDVLIGVFSVLLAASASMFFLLSIADSRRAAADVTPTGPALALDDLVGARHPMLPHTIRQTPLG